VCQPLYGDELNFWCTDLRILFADSSGIRRKPAVALSITDVLSALESGTIANAFCSNG